MAIGSIGNKTDGNPKPGTRIVARIDHVIQSILGNVRNAVDTISFERFIYSFTFILN